MSPASCALAVQSPAMETLSSVFFSLRQPRSYNVQNVFCCLPGPTNRTTIPACGWYVQDMASLSCGMGAVGTTLVYDI